MSVLGENEKTRKIDFDRIKHDNDVQGLTYLAIACFVGSFAFLLLWWFS